MAEKIMNLRGLKCPLPALRVKKVLSALKSGEVVIAECTDPMAAIDIPNLVRQTGDTLEAKDIGLNAAKAAETGLLTFRIRKK